MQNSKINSSNSLGREQQKIKSNNYPRTHFNQILWLYQVYKRHHKVTKMDDRSPFLN